MEVIYEDEDLVAVNKPPGVITAPKHRYVGGSMVNRIIGVWQVGAAGHVGSLVWAAVGPVGGEYCKKICLDFRGRLGDSFAKAMEKPKLCQSTFSNIVCMLVWFLLRCLGGHGQPCSPAGLPTSFGTYRCQLPVHMLCHNHSSESLQGCWALSHSRCTAWI